MFWTKKYEPKSLDEFAGQRPVVEQAQAWLKTWKAGRALLLYGPTGTGKTLLARLLACQHRLKLTEPAEDETKNVDSLRKFFTRPIWHKGRLILIELDCLSGHDRGVIAAITELVKECPWPVILTTTDPWQPRLRPLHTCCQLLKFTKIPAQVIASKLKHIAHAEKIGYDEEVINRLAELAKGDLRAAITDLQLLATKEIGKKEMENLGWREKQSDIFSLLQTIFRNQAIEQNRQAIWLADRDPDEIFLWIEQNLAAEFSQKELPAAYELLAKANLFRAKVPKQQNWRFKGYMADMLAGLAALKQKPGHGYLAYRPPLSLWMRKNPTLQNLALKIGNHCHCSARIAKREYLPFLKIIKPHFIAGIELEKEEIEILNG